MASPHNFNADVEFGAILQSQIDILDTDQNNQYHIQSEIPSQQAGEEESRSHTILGTGGTHPYEHNMNSHGNAFWSTAIPEAWSTTGPTVAGDALHYQYPSPPLSYPGLGLVDENNDLPEVPVEPDFADIASRGMRLSHVPNLEVAAQQQIPAPKQSSRKRQAESTPTSESLEPPAAKRVRKSSALAARLAKVPGPAGANRAVKGITRLDEHGRLEWRAKKSDTWRFAGYHRDFRQEFINQDAMQAGSYLHTPKAGKVSEPLNITSYCPAQQNWTPDKATVTDSQGRQILFLIDAPEDYIHNPRMGPTIHRGLIILDNDDHPVRDFPGVPLCFSTEIEGWRLEGLRRCTGMTTIDFMARMLPSRQSNSKVLPLQSMAAFTNRTNRWRKEKNVTAWRDHGEESKNVKQFIIDQLADPEAKTTESLGDLTRAQLKELYDLNKGKHGYKSRYEQPQNAKPLPPAADKASKPQNESNEAPSPAVLNSSGESNKALKTDLDTDPRENIRRRRRQDSTPDVRQMKRGAAELGEEDFSYNKKQRVFDGSYENQQLITIGEDERSVHHNGPSRNTHGVERFERPAVTNCDGRLGRKKNESTHRYRASPLSQQQLGLYEPYYNNSGATNLSQSQRLGHRSDSAYDQASHHGYNPNVQGSASYAVNATNHSDHKDAIIPLDLGRQHSFPEPKDSYSSDGVPFFNVEEYETQMTRPSLHDRPAENGSLDTKVPNLDYTQPTPLNETEGLLTTSVAHGNDDDSSYRSYFDEFAGYADDTATQYYF